MNHTHRICRRLAYQVGRAGALLACGVAVPVALSNPLPGPGWTKHPPGPAMIHAAPAGGLPGWQITLIAVGAAVLAAAVVVLRNRVPAAWRRVTAGS
jgi:hypothetical protein